MSLLNKFQTRGVAITRIYDGMEWEKVTGDHNLQIRKNATEIVTSVDISTVQVEHDGVIGLLTIVLGNDESEILCDYSAKKDSQLMHIIDKVADEFYTQWE